jgi:photosystem II stability/assembly factor-like uncharacterized protein
MEKVLINIVYKLPWNRKLLPIFVTTLNVKKMKKNLTLIVLLLISAFAGYSQTWEKINTGFNYILRGIEFPNNQSQIGFAGGESVTYMGDGIVIKTTNGGTTWTSLWTGTDQGLEDICFTDLNTGYVCGWSAYFAKTTDGGLTWTPQFPGGAEVDHYKGVAFKDANNGVAVAQTMTGSMVYVTSNGGTTWTPGSGLAAVPNKLVYVTANTYYLVDNGGNVQKSTDGGTSWNTVFESGSIFLTGIDFLNSMVGMAGTEEGMIYKTIDGGATWQQQQIAFGQPIWRDFAWSNPTDVYVVGTPEFIYKSTDAGGTWNDDYPASAYDAALYEVMFTNDGLTYVCGSQGWFFRKSPELTALFTANNTTICSGGSVQFTDQSLGEPTGWNWIFEGGTPATSTLQNPSVTYSTPGVFDVTLLVTQGAITSTLSSPDMIHVESPVTVAPTQPVGPTELCGTFNYQYTTTAVAEATSYAWTVEPASAGTFSGNGLTGTLTASNTWNGSFTVKVAGVNACGSGPVSPVLNGTLTHQPVLYSLFSGGGYCAGQSGYEIKLEDSEIGVDYQLFKDGLASGTPLPGTGFQLSFGNQTIGTYTVTGVNGSCSANMLGSSIVYIIDPVAAASQPSGPATTCNNVPSTFTAPLPANGYTLVWTLTPSEAGTLTQPTTTSVLVTWNPAFSGEVAVTVQGENECGPGAASPAHIIEVNPLPSPLATGITTVCKTQEITYTTALNSGSTYAWAVTGGTITSGQGSNQVSVVWGNPGVGTVSVTETSAANCAGVSPLLTVAIDECTGISESKADALSVYPNPAADQLNLVLGSGITGNVRIVIYNHLGQSVYQSSEIKNANNNPVKIDITRFNPGTYTIQVISERDVLSKVFVKK